MSDSPSRPARWSARRLVRSCLVAIGFFLLLYLLNYAYHFTSSLIHEQTWNDRGYDSYTASFYQSFPGANWFPEVVKVRSGQVISRDWPNCSGAQCETFAQTTPSTIQGMFELAKHCGILFPMVTCRTTYNANYGYPEQVLVDCWWLPDVCTTYHTVQDVRPLP